jgi:serine/threonine protein kinase
MASLAMDKIEIGQGNALEEPMNESHNKAVPFYKLSMKEVTATPKKKQILGTPDYIAPEVIQCLEVNYMLDFWSLGIIGYEVMTGDLPFNDYSPELILENIKKKKIPWPEEGLGAG